LIEDRLIEGTEESDQGQEGQTHLYYAFHGGGLHCTYARSICLNVEVWHSQAVDFLIAAKPASCA
jgi:hypothetical protein